MIKIGFDASDLGTMRADGTTKYAYELLKRLPGMVPDSEWEILSPLSSESLETLTKSDTNIKLNISPWPKGWTQFRLPLELYHSKLDVLLMPIQQLPYIRPGKLKTIAVVHDLAFHQFGEQFRFKDWWLLHTFTAYAVKNADQIIAVSKATAADIAQYYGRIHGLTVVHHGIDQEKFRLPADGEKQASGEKLRQLDPKIRQPYLLFVGQIQPRKNLVRLIEAFEKLQAKNPVLRLVIAGGHGWLQEPIKKRVKESKYAGNILMTGRVPDDLLAPLYWNAEVLVLPSLNEGFGMPILEAMACGCPVVTSNVSAMPEVAGGAAILIDPLDSQSLAAGINSARGRRNELITKGIINAAKFSWEKCARETALIIQSLTK